MIWLVFSKGVEQSYFIKDIYLSRFWEDATEARSTPSRMQKCTISEVLSCDASLEGGEAGVKNKSMHWLGRLVMEGMGWQTKREVGVIFFQKARQAAVK